MAPTFLSEIVKAISVVLDDLARNANHIDCVNLSSFWMLTLTLHWR